jgi:hypothetical protein
MRANKIKIDRIREFSFFEKEIEKERLKRIKKHAIKAEKNSEGIPYFLMAIVIVFCLHAIKNLLLIIV